MSSKNMVYDDIIRPTRPVSMSILAVPLPFEGVTGIRQLNAIWSWNEMLVKGKTYLLTEDVLTVDDWDLLPVRVAGLCPVETDEFGTPLISSIFDFAQLYAEEEPIAYINSDVIVSGLDGAVQVCEEQFDEFLIIGRRHDLDISDYLDFDIPWEMDLLMLIEEDGDLHSSGAIDWFAFTPDVYDYIPPFAIGRSAWDNWLVIEALKKGIPVIDASQVTLTVHQNMRTHIYHGISKERKIQRDRNRDFYNMDRLHYTGSSRDATWLLTPKGLIKK